MNPTHKDENQDTPGREPLGDIDPTSDSKDEFPRQRPDRANDRDRSTHVNDGNVGEERRDREPSDPQKNPRTGPIG